MRLVALLPALILAACGSGAVSGPPPPAAPLTVLPASAVIYAGQPTTFQIAGGIPPYIATSSNQAALPVSGTTGGTLTVLPGLVSVPTDLTLAIDDSRPGGGISIPITVRPSIVSSIVTITPTSTQGGACLPAICSGGDAEIAATLTLDSQPLANRTVRFEVVSGDFQFITGSGTAATTTVQTDSTGKARARIRIVASAPNQTALLRVVDIETGSFTSLGFTIAQATGGSPGFFASPDSVTFSGATTGQCAANTSANVYIFGGTPPYTVSQPGAAFDINPNVIGQSGDFFTVFPSGICVAEPGFPVTIQDAAGRTTTVSLSNVPGTADPPALVVAPDEVTLASCSDVATISIAGGTGHYTVRSSHTSVTARLLGSSINVQRTKNTNPVTPVEVAVTSGAEIETVTVNLTGAALSTLCP